MIKNIWDIIKVVYLLFLFKFICVFMLEVGNGIYMCMIYIFNYGLFIIYS